MKDRNIYAYELVRIVRELYPKQSVGHSFKTELLLLKDHFNATDLLLINDLIKVFTLLNQKDRASSEDHKQLLSTQSDFRNAVYLITDPANKLSEKRLKFLTDLHEKYGFESFTHLYAALDLQRSISAIKRLMKPLVYHGLVVVTSRKKSTGELTFRVNAHSKPTQKEPQNCRLSIFEEATEEWGEFKGWFDTQNRT
ncbi:MAG: hypothetical protein L3J01_05985 [Thiomicrorhabdus sp.]|nr:hypothetical protein [Thiomicrorhabdus sp.]